MAKIENLKLFHGQSLIAVAGLLSGRKINYSGLVSGKFDMRNL